MHAADKNTSCVQQHKTTKKHMAEHEPHATQKNTIHVDRRVYGLSKLETAHSHNKTEHGVQVSKPRHEIQQDMSAILWHGYYATVGSFHFFQSCLCEIKQHCFIILDTFECYNATLCVCHCLIKSRTY